MDKETKVFLWFIGFMVLIVFPIFVLGAVRLETKIDACSKQGGIVVNSANRFICVDAKVIRTNNE